MDGAPPSYEETTSSKPPYPTGSTANPTPNPGGAGYPPTNAAPPPGSSFYPPQNPGGAAYPPAPGAPMTQTNVQGGASGSTVVVTQPQAMVFRANPYGFIPVSVQCPHCQQQTVTVLEYRNGGMTWLACGVTCFIAMWFLCCCLGLIPFCVDGLKDVVHKCGHCHQEIGYRKRLS